MNQQAAILLVLAILIMRLSFALTLHVFRRSIRKHDIVGVRVPGGQIVNHYVVEVHPEVLYVASSPGRRRDAATAVVIEDVFFPKQLG